MQLLIFSFFFVQWCFVRTSITIVILLIDITVFIFSVLIRFRWENFTAWSLTHQLKICRFEHTFWALNLVFRFFFHSICLILFCFILFNIILQWAFWLTSLLSFSRAIERSTRDFSIDNVKDIEFELFIWRWQRIEKMFHVFEQSSLRYRCTTWSWIDKWNLMRKYLTTSIKLNSNEFYELIWFDLEMIAARSVDWIEK